MNKIKKVYRYFTIYGIARTLNKVVGRNRSLTFLGPFYFGKSPSIGLIGCGQFQFSTIAYFLSRSFTNRFSFCFDIDYFNSKSLAKYYSIPIVLKDIEDCFNVSDLKLVYIASNHASHTDYAIQFLNKNIDVYCEKPISVNFDQFNALKIAIGLSSGSFYAGYNRPFSQAVIQIKKLFNIKNFLNGKFSLNCFVTAHDIPPHHWYRNPKEGTRICGNVGHWLDLMIHIYNWRGYIPKKFTIQIAYSNIKEPDDNICISISTPEGDLTSITITARSEPFEGINETINFQYDTIIAKIDDFRNLVVWDEEKKYNKKYWIKDVGHKVSVMQPFEKNKRDLSEVFASTELMLNITDMVRNGEKEKEVQLT
ncbi:Gfo/Idh/MocA family protein [Aquiflexum sp.]|uniref:Gfo/Idh/MocA family protein n=1 Tax=Aquiflexum sp. TaxID=1872584 RepID=UPI0035944935